MERDSLTSSYRNDSPRNFAFPYTTQHKQMSSISASERGSAFAQPLFSSKKINAEEDPILKSMGEYLKKEKETQEEKIVLGLLGNNLADNREQIEQNKENQEEKEVLKFIGSEMFNPQKENQEEKEVLKFIGSEMFNPQKENQIAEFEREKIERILKVQFDDDNISEKKFEKLVFKTPNISFLSNKNERNSEEAIRPHLGGNESSKFLSNKSFNGRPSNNSNPIESKLEISRVLSVPPRASANKVPIEPKLEISRVLSVPPKAFANKNDDEKKKKLEELKNEADDILKELRKGQEIGFNIERKMNAF